MMCLRGYERSLTLAPLMLHHVLFVISAPPVATHPDSVNHNRSNDVIEWSPPRDTIGWIVYFGASLCRGIYGLVRASCS